ncbi:MAG: hypothetical protein QXI71_06295 [Candidatus Bathyarchaeia archaeon]|nr:hypothetical protein [Candidatus Bathyarchaeota archaeon]
MKNELEMEFTAVWSVIFVVLNLAFSYLEFGVIEKFYCLIVSLGLLRLYYYNKEKKEEDKT